MANTFDLCVPAHNEAPIIQDALSKIQAALETLDNVSWRIIVSDNASTDTTREVVRSMKHPRILITSTKEKGKGGAIIRVAQKSTADFFGFIDADLSADPSDIATLLLAVQSGVADVAIGSRLVDTHLVHRGFLRTLSSRVFNILRGALIGIHIKDSQCGLKIMNARARGILARCTETGWFLDMEFLARAERAGLSIKEIPIHWEEEAYSGRGSKLRIVRDGIGAVFAMIRIRSKIKR